MPTIKKTVGQITLKVLTDVESTTYYYLLQSSMAPAPSAPTTNPPSGGWSTTEPEFFSYIPTQDTIVVSGKDYYTRSGSAGSYTYTIVSNPTGNPSTNSYYEKIYGDTRSLYVTVQTLYTDGTYDYTTPSLSSSYEAAKEAYNRAQSALTIAGDINQYFWALSSSYSTDVPAGVYVTNIPQNQFKSAPAQGNILMQSTGLTIRNGAIPLASLTGTALNFYNPTTHEANATLSSGGLILSKGGIRVNTVGSNNGVYISSDNLGSSIALDNNIKTNWRAVIGSKFGVDSEGNLYANNAHLSSANVEGAITATSLTIGSGSNAYDGAAAINISGYDIEIEKNGTDEVEDVSVYLYPILYHNGIKVEEYTLSTDTTVNISKDYYTRSGSAGSYTYTIVSNPSGNPSTQLYYEKQINYSHFIWYQDDDTIGTEGDENNKGRYLATYGHNYRVIYDFDDGAVGGGTEVQTRTVDPSKYITKVSDTGITIHPEVWSNQSSYIQLDANGLNLFDSNSNSIAQYGSTARIGLNNSSRFLVNSNSLQAYDNNNNKYFEVNANGLSWGTQTAATTQQVSNLSTQMNSAIETAVDEIEIGGRNLLLNTSKSAVFQKAITAGSYSVLDAYTMVTDYSSLGLVVDDYVTISFDWSITGVPSGTVTAKVGTNVTPWEYFGIVNTYSAGSSSGHTEKSYKITSALALCTGTQLRFRIDSSVAVTAGDMVLTITNAKLEKGNKATDWTPAPEDVTEYTDSAVDAIALKTGLKSGKIATFDASAYPALDIDADIDPIQDLHGYNAPWVGGAGKNILPITMTTHTINGVTFTVNSDGTIKVNGTATAVIREAVVENMAFASGTTYTISGNPISSSAITLYVANSQSTIGISNPVDTGIGATFTPTQSGSTAVRIFLDNGQTANNLVFKPMIRLSNTSADFEPYENICPISGHTEVDVVRAGKNLLPYPYANTTKVHNGITFTDNGDGTITANGTATAEAQFVLTSRLPNSEWTGKILSGCPQGGSTSTYYITAQVFGSPWTAFARDIGNGVTITDSGYTNIRFIIAIKGGQTVNNLTFKPMIRLATEADATYEAYNGNTYTTSLGRTVYGGTLDVLSGELTVTHGFITFDGSENWSWSSGSLRPNITVSGIKQYGEVQTNYYPYSSSSTKVEGTITTNGGGGYNIWICDSVNAPDLATWKTFLSTHNLQVVYELATPQTYQLTPTQVKLLQGTNNVWCDTGDINIKYAIIADSAAEVLASPIDRASKVATSYITKIDGGGIKVHDEEDEDNYAKIDATGLEVFNDVDNISTSVAKFGATSRIGEFASKTPHIEMNNRFMEINNNEKSYFGAGFVNQSASLIRIPFEAKYCTGTTTLTLTTNCTIASINEIRGYNMAAKVIPLVPNLNYVFVPGTNTITLLNLDNLFIESSYEFYIDYNTAQFSSLQGTYAPILNEFNTFFGDTYFPEYTITGLISARVDGDETSQLTYTLNQDGSITFDNIGTNDSHYIYISYVTSDTLFAVTSENQTGAIGVNSVSFGKGNSVSGGYSAAIGKGLTTIANSQMAIGRYNKCEPDSLFMVGNGDEPYNLGLCLILSNASNHPVLKMNLSKVSDTIQGGSFYFTTSDQYKWFCEIPWYDPDDPIQDITNSAFRVDDSTIDFGAHEAVDSIDVIAIMLSQRMDEGEHNVYLNSNTNIVPATNTSTMIYATLAPLERNVFEVKTNGDVLINEALVGDFVIEQGTSGDWTYQKWNSGIVECWGYHTFSSATWAAYLSGGLYYTTPQLQKAFPFNIYNARPYVNVRSVGSNVGWVANVSCDDTGFGVTIVRNGNTGAIGLWVHVKGNWM